MPLPSDRQIKPVFYRCHNAARAHGFCLRFDQLPPELCPACNAPVGHTTEAKMREATPIHVEPAQPFFPRRPEPVKR